MIAVLIGLDIPIAIDRDEAQRRAMAELAKAKYGGTPEWLHRVGDRTSSWLERLAELLGRWQADQQTGGGVSPGFVIAVVVLLAAIALVVWRVGLPRWRRRSVGEPLDLDPSRPAADYRSLAEQHAATGDWRAAVRDRFRAVVRELEIRTILDVRPARTAWEAAYAATRTLPSARDALHTGAQLFNDVVYGDGAADEAAYASMVAVDTEVSTAADAVDLAADPDPVGA